MKKITIHKTELFEEWLEKLKDDRAKARITQRIHRLSLGNAGQHRVLKHGVTELKIDHGPGYRVYFVSQGAALVILLCGGDKATQAKDIKKAYSLAQEVLNEN